MISGMNVCILSINAVKCKSLIKTLKKVPPLLSPLPRPPFFLFNALSDFTLRNYKRR